MTRSGIGVGATLTPPAQLSLCSRFAALLIKGRMEFVVPPKRDSSPRRVIARGACQTSPLQRRGDGAPKSANLWFRDLSRDHGAPLGAPIAAVTEPGPAFPA